MIRYWSLGTIVISDWVLCSDQKLVIRNIGVWLLVSFLNKVAKGVKKLIKSRKKKLINWQNLQYICFGSIFCSVWIGCPAKDKDSM